MFMEENVVVEFLWSPARQLSPTGPTDACGGPREQPFQLPCRQGAFAQGQGWALSATLEGKEPNHSELFTLLA